MKSAAQGKELSREIVELLKDATPEQKLVIKGILMGAKEFESKAEKNPDNLPYIPYRG